VTVVFYFHYMVLIVSSFCTISLKYSKISLLISSFSNAKLIKACAYPSLSPVSYLLSGMIWVNNPYW